VTPVFSFACQFLRDTIRKQINISQCTRASITILFPYQSNLYFTDRLIIEPVDSAEVIEGISHGELSYQGDILRHVTHSRPRDGGILAAWSSPQDPYLTAVKTSNSDDAGQQGGLAATAGPQ
jgi:hypothetical protein